jgi:L-fuconate dehydratase
VAGVNENIASMLLTEVRRAGLPARRRRRPVRDRPALSMFDYVALSGTTQGGRLEWIDHLHEHFAAPAVVTGGRYCAPRVPGASTEILPESLAGVQLPVRPSVARRRDALTVDLGPLVLGPLIFGGAPIGEGVLNPS